MKVTINERGASQLEKIMNAFVGEVQADLIGRRNQTNGRTPASSGEQASEVHGIS